MFDTTACVFFTFPMCAACSKEGLKYANRVQLKDVPPYADVEKKAKTTFIVASLLLRTKFLGCVVRFVHPSVRSR